jgi:NADH:ubiquinone oxidoreductase subunit 5 (subunit L)/multisubunit Na+/H+ antiporter MnhA subunit
MPAPALLLLLAVCLPLLMVGLLAVLGRRLGTPLAGWAATALAALSFGASLWALVLWCSPGGRHFHGVSWGMRERPINLSAAASSGSAVQQESSPLRDLGIYIDSLTIAMFALITLVAVLAGAFAIGFMRGDPHYPRFFLLLSLLVFSILALVLSGSLILVLLFWACGAVASHLLIGFWKPAPAPALAARRTTLLLGVGDLLLLIGVVFLARCAGTLHYPKLWAVLSDADIGQAIFVRGHRLSAALLTAIEICLVLGIGARAALFPLHAWWGDAAEAPTPALTILQSAGFSVCGIYLLARLFPILTPNAKLLLAILGASTALLAALIAIAHFDIKRVICFCILSQLGTIAMAIGIGSWGGGLFHLITCGFVGSLLLLGCGSVIWGAGHHRRLAELGGLWPRMPVTAATFAVGALSLAGVPALAVEHSRAMILADAASFASLAAQFGGRSAMYWAFFVIPIISALLVAFALTRCWMLIFWGKPRRRDVYEKATEHSVLWTPLLMLAVLAIFAGSVLGAADLLGASMSESSAEAQTWVKSGGAITEPSRYFIFDSAWPMQSSGPVIAAEAAEALTDTPPDLFTPAAYAQAHGQLLQRRWLRWTWIVGIVASLLMYRRGYHHPRQLQRRVPPLRHVRLWLADEMSFMAMYEWTFARPLWGILQSASQAAKAILQRMLGP